MQDTMDELEECASDLKHRRKARFTQSSNGDRHWQEKVERMRREQELWESKLDKADFSSSALDVTNSPTRMPTHRSPEAKFYGRPFV